MANKNKGFRLNAEKLFMTYPQCEVDPHGALLCLQQNKYLQNKIKNYIIAQEVHQDGNKHLHVYLHLNKKVDIKNQYGLDLKFFDTGFGGDNGGINDHQTYHGNYQTVRNTIAVMKYVTKETNYISSYTEEELINLGKKDEGAQKTSIWVKAITLAKDGNPNDAIKLLETNGSGAMALCKSKDQIINNLKSMGPRIIHECKHDIDSFFGIHSYGELIQHLYFMVLLIVVKQVLLKLYYLMLLLYHKWMLFVLMTYLLVSYSTI